MRIVIQRVSHASVTIEGDVKSAIQQGYLILFGVEESDTSEDVDWLVKKVIGLRVFDDENHVMNRSIMDINGEILVISQFTLFASYKKGNRPSWYRAAKHALRGVWQEAFRSPRKASRNGGIWCRHEGRITQRRSCHHYDGYPQQRVK